MGTISDRVFTEEIGTMSDHGGEENEEKNEEDDDDRIKNLELEQLLALPNDEEWDLSDSEFFNFFQGWQNVPSPSLLAAAPLDNQPIIHHQNNPTQDDPNSKKKRRYLPPFPFCFENFGLDMVSELGTVLWLLSHP